MTKRRNFSDKFKATVALEALRGDKTVQEIAAKRQLHPSGHTKSGMNTNQMHLSQAASLS